MSVALPVNRISAMSVLDLCLLSQDKLQSFQFLAVVGLRARQSILMFRAGMHDHCDVVQIKGHARYEDGITVSTKRLEGLEGR